MAQNDITNITPEVWSMVILQLLYEKAIAAGLIAKTYEGEAKKAKKVYVPSPTAVSVGTYTPGSDISIQSVTPTKQAIEIDQYNYWAIGDDDVERLFAKPSISELYVPQGLIDMADYIDAALFTWMYGGAGLTVDAADAPTPGAGGAGIVLVAGAPSTTSEMQPSQVLARAKRKMDEAKVPKDGRVCACSARFVEILTQQSVITGHNSVGYSARAVMDGAVARLHGFDLVESTNLTKASSKRHMVAFHPSFGAFVGVHDSLERVRRELRFGNVIRALYVWGRKVLDSNRLVDVVIAEA